MPVDPWTNSPSNLDRTINADYHWFTFWVALILLALSVYQNSLGIWADQPVSTSLPSRREALITCHSFSQYVVYSLFLGLHGFHDTKLTPIVRNAYHAISIHDQRAWFSPTLMHFSEVAPDHHQSLEQVWFPGMHGDVGGQEVGTYNNLLSCHSLHWMMNRARKNGLKFKNNETTCSSADHHFIYDDSYNSSIIYKLMPRQDRVIAKDEVTDDYRLSQLYENGEFSSYLTQEQLSMYKSKTLKEFYKHYNDQ